MKFDRKAPGEGLEITATMQSGKAYLECKVHLKWEGEETLSLLPSAEKYLDIRIWDRENRPVFRCHHPLWQEEPAKGILLHPGLWQGTEDPYLYRVRAALMNGKECMADVLEKPLALRSFVEIPMKGWFLNDKSFEIRAVAYEIPEAKEAAVAADRALRETQIRRDLVLIKEMGANGICPIGGVCDEMFCRICDETGFILWRQFDEKMPRFRGMADGLVSLDNQFPTDRYYYYKACWSKEPFVYVSMESLTLQPNGNVRVTVYSNRKKVALYVDGVLFEFRTEGPDFVFEGIPVKNFPLLLTAETGECSMSVTAYPVHKRLQEQNL